MTQNQTLHKSLFDMMGYGARLRFSMNSHQPPRSRKEVSEALGITVQALGLVLNGKTKSLTAENNAVAARFLGVDPTWLATGRTGDSDESSSVQAPVKSQPGSNPGVILAIKYFGNSRTLSKVLNVSSQAVFWWRDGERRFPAELAPTLERLTGGEVRCEFLCPDVEWSVLRKD